MLKIHESFDAEGRRVEVNLRSDDGRLSLVDSEASFPLPEGALTKVMERYGAPVDPSERVTHVASLDVGAEGRLVHLRHLARFDVIARDYLVIERAGREPLCALATTVAAALGHLGRRARGIP